MWALAEPIELAGVLHDLGEDVSDPVPDQTCPIGASALVKLGATMVRAECILVAGAPSWCDYRRKMLVHLLKVAPSEDEGARVLAPEFGGGAPDQPERYRSLENAFRHCKPQEFADFPIPNPRTAHYYGKDVLKQGISFISRHRTWRTENRLGEEDAGVVDHSVFCEVLDYLYCYDQLDGTNLACAERICRCLQLIEEGQRQKMEEQMLRQGKDSFFATVGRHFDGRMKALGGAIVSPALLSSATDSAKTESEVFRQQRKAVEARLPLREQPGKNK